MMQSGMHADMLNFTAMPGTTSLRVLLVDDEQDICALLSAMLSNEGAHTSAAYSKAEAQSALRASVFDLVFVDIHLEDGLGYDLIPLIRQSSPRARIIAISAVDGEGANALQKGVDLFLPKPFSRRRILEVVHTLFPKT